MQIFANFSHPQKKYLSLSTSKMQESKETRATITTKEELDNLYKDIQASLATKETKAENNQE